MQVTIDVPDKEREQYRPGVHHPEENREVSLHQGPSVAFTWESVRIYDADRDQFVELSNRELVELLAAAYGME